MKKDVYGDSGADMGGAICGGVISESKLKSDQKKYGVWADMMCYVMPDDKFAQYQKLKEENWDSKEAKKLFDKHAWSMI